MRFQGTLSEPGSVTINGHAAAMVTELDGSSNPVFRFAAEVALNDGTNLVDLVARNGSGAETDPPQQYIVEVNAGGGTAPGYDADGNMVSNGAGQQYRWDGEMRLIGIDYADGGSTEFTYDALGRRVKIVERDGLDAVTSDKRLLWVDLEICEERDAANAVTKRYHTHGMTVPNESGWTKYFYTRDHLGSVRDLTDQNGVPVETYRYDPYGNQVKRPASLPATATLLDHFDAADAEMDGQGVTEWTDKVGTGHWYALSPSRGPEKVLNALNGRPVLRFDGADDEMFGKSVFFGSRYTMAIVHRRLGGSGDQAVLSAGDKVTSIAPVPTGTKSLVSHANGGLRFGNKESGSWVGPVVEERGFAAACPAGTCYCFGASDMSASEAERRTSSVAKAPVA